jgi:UDP-N-acetylglucosamine:LPS N-acetylglucosamine transferase
MPKKILFFPDVYQEHGHWHPAITLAQVLSSRGHDVRFMGIADCRSIVEPYVSSVENSFFTVFKDEYPLGYTKSHQHRSVSERWKPVHLWNINGGGLDSLMGEFSPDLVICGYFASLETLLMHYRYSVDFMVLTTYLRHPDDDPGIRAVQNLVGMSEPMSRKIMGARDESMPIHEFVRPLESATELVPCPRALEFGNYRFDFDADPASSRVKFIEPCIARNVINSSVLKDKDKWKAGIQSKLGGNKIIFATAGSQTQDYKDKARLWFREMVKMMGLPGMQEYHLVMSVGPDLSLEDWSQPEALPGNASAHSWVPQDDVLGRSAVAYIHGGLATIKECICKNVPFIILPLGKDQMDNALRVRHAGIAQVAYAEAADFRELQNLFLQARTDAWMKKKLIDMQAKFAEMEVSKPGIGIIEQKLGVS